MINSTKETIKTLMFHIVLWGSCLLAVYIAFGMLFVEPIIQCFIALDANNLTIKTVIISLVKVIFSGSIGMAIAYIGWIIASFINKL